MLGSQAAVPVNGPPGAEGRSLRPSRVAGSSRLSTGAESECTECRDFQASSANPKGHKSQKWKTRVRNKTLGFLLTVSHFLLAINNHT